MKLAGLTDPGAVLQSVNEFDALGRTQFLTQYGYGPARRYFLAYNGKRYDSKAIAGVAFGFQHPSQGPLKRTDFSGGEKTVQRKLESLGFTIEVTGRG